MSYILDALKKADRERKQQQIPDLETEHHDNIPAPPVNNRINQLNLWVMAALFILAGITIFLFIQQKKTVVTIENKTSSISLPEETVRPDNSHSTKQPVANGQNPDTTTIDSRPDNDVKIPDVISPEPDRATEQSTANTKVNLPLLSDLPLILQEEIPALTLAGHVYSEEADRRMIMINNKIMREGQTVMPNLRLEQITWKGVILRYHTTQFRFETL